MAQREKESGMSNSFVDLMTSLAVIFILLLCASLNNAQQEGQRNRNSVLVEMQNKLKDFVSAGIEVKSDPRDPLGLLVLVPENLLAFRFDRADISPAGDTFLRSFIPRLARVVCAPGFSREIHSIVVEWHTDSSGPAGHNWNLSQMRSMSVVNAGMNILDQARMMEEKAVFLQLLSASGRGSAEPIVDPSGKENSSMSRRVVFKLRFRSMEQKPIVEALRANASGL